MKYTYNHNWIRYIFVSSIISLLLVSSVSGFSQTFIERDTNAQVTSTNPILGLNNADSIYTGSNDQLLVTITNNNTTTFYGVITIQINRKTIVFSSSNDTTKQLTIQPNQTKQITVDVRNAKPKNEYITYQIKGEFNNIQTTIEQSKTQIIKQNNNGNGNNGKGNNKNK